MAILYGGREVPCARRRASLPHSACEQNKKTVGVDTGQSSPGAAQELVGVWSEAVGGARVAQRGVGEQPRAARSSPGASSPKRPAPTLSRMRGDDDGDD